MMKKKKTSLSLHAYQQLRRPNINFDDDETDSEPSKAFPFLNLPYLAQREVINHLDLATFVSFRRTCSHVNNLLMKSDVQLTKQMDRIFVNENNITFSYVTLKGQFMENDWNKLSTLPSRCKLKIQANTLCIDHILDDEKLEELIRLLTKHKATINSIECVRPVICDPLRFINLLKICHATAVQFCSSMSFNPFQLPELQNLRYLQFSQCMPSDEEFLSLRVDGLKIRGDSISNLAIRTYLSDLAKGLRSPKSTCLIEFDETFNFTQDDIIDITDDVASVLWTPELHHNSMISTLQLQYPLSEYHVYIVNSQVVNGHLWKVVFHHGHLTIQPVADIRHALPLTHHQYRQMFRECYECLPSNNQTCIHLNHFQNISSSSKKTVSSGYRKGQGSGVSNLKTMFYSLEIRSLKTLILLSKTRKEAKWKRSKRFSI